MSIETEETRREANEKVDKKLRRKQVLEILADKSEATAKEIARCMAYRSYTKEIDYNSARPRLTELLEDRCVCIIRQEARRRNKLQRMCLYNNTKTE